MTIDLRTRANGTYTFGSIPAPPPSKEKGRAPYKGEINYYPLSHSMYWQTAYNSFSVANSTYQSEWMTGLEDAGLPTGANDPTRTSSAGPTASTDDPDAENSTLREAIVDTGTSIILLPPSIVNKYYAHVPGAVYRVDYGIWTFPCDLKVPVHTRSSAPSAADEEKEDGKKGQSTPVLPDLKIAFGEEGGWHATIPGPLLNYSVIDVYEDEDDYSSTGGARPVTLDVEGEKEADPEKITVCMGGVQSFPDMDVGILGDTFLKAVFVVLDMRGRVGFADKDL